MRITERKLRDMTREIMKELFGKKRALSAKNLLDKEIDPYDYSGDGAVGGGFYEADETDEENVSEDEENVE